MSDEEHIEPEPPTAEELGDRLYVVAMAGILGFVAVVFIFIL